MQDQTLQQLIAANLDVQVFLVNGIRLVGRLQAHDKYSITLLHNEVQQIVYKSAISTMSLAPANHTPREPRDGPRPERSTVRRTYTP